MRFLTFKLIGMIPWVLLMGCASLQSGRNDAESPVVAELSDAHGLWGGDELIIRENGKVFLKRITIGDRGGKIERHYKRKLSEAEMTELKSFITDSGYFRYREVVRPGIPDEAHPEITVQFKGNSNKAAKWANDYNPKFDLVYKRLMSLADLTAKSRPVKVRYPD